MPRLQRASVHARRMPGVGALPGPRFSAPAACVWRPSNQPEFPGCVRVPLFDIAPAQPRQPPERAAVTIITVGFTTPTTTSASAALALPVPQTPRWPEEPLPFMSDINP